MKKGTVVINPYVNKTYKGEPNPIYATAYLSPHKTIGRDGKIYEWTDDVRNWQVIGFIDLSLEDKFDEVLRIECKGWNEFAEYYCEQQYKKKEKCRLGGE